MSEKERPNQADLTPKAPGKTHRAVRVFRRLLTAVLVLVLLPVLVFASVCLISRTEQGARWIVNGLNPALQAALAPMGLSLHLQGLRSELPFAVNVSGIELSDKHGVWFQAEHLSLAINWRALLKRNIEVSDLSLEHPVFLRLPELSPSSAPEPETSSPVLTPYNLFQLFPAWLVDLNPEFNISHLFVNGFELSPAIAGEAMTLDLGASASLSPTKLAVQAALARRSLPDKHEPDGHEALTLALKLTSTGVLGLQLIADEGPSGLAARFLPPELAKRPRLLFELEGNAPLDNWKGDLHFLLADLDAPPANAGDMGSGEASGKEPGKAAPSHPLEQGETQNSLSKLQFSGLSADIPPACHVITLEGQISLNLPPEQAAVLSLEEGNTGNPWLPRDIALELTLQNGQAADKLIRMAGLNQGAASVKLSVHTALNPVQNGLALDTEATLFTQAKNTRWEDARLAALLGNALTAKLALKLGYAPEELQVKLPVLSFNAGILSAEGNAAFSLPGSALFDSAPSSASGDLSNSPTAVENSAEVSVKAAMPDKKGGSNAFNIPAVLAQALVDIELHADARPDARLIAMLAPDAKKHLELDGPALLDAKLSGAPLSPRARIDLSCPGLAVEGEKIRDVFLHARLDSLKDDSSDISLTGGLDAGLTLRGETVSLKTDWIARHDRAGILAATLRNASLRVGGVQAEGTLSAVLENGKPPRLDGGLLAEVRDWKLLSVLTGQKLNGSGAHFELALKHEGEKQIAGLKGGMESFSLGGVPAEKGEQLTLTGLHVNLDARDVWSAAVLDAGLSVSGLKAGGIALKNITSAIDGSLAGPLNLTAGTEGEIKSRLNATWNPGKVELKALSVEPGSLPNSRRRTRNASRNPAPLPSIVLLSPGSLTYSAAAFSTSGLHFKLPPDGKLMLKGSYDPAKLNLDMELQGLQFAPLRMFVKDLPDGNVNATLALRGTLDSPAGTLRAEVRDVRFPGSELVPLACDLNADLKHPGGQSILDARLEIPVTSLVLLGARQGWARIRLPLERNGNSLIPSRNRSMEATLRWDGVISPLWAYLPIGDRRMNGGIHLAADISGTFAQPKIDADVEISNAAFEDLALGVLLTNINAKAGYNDQTGGVKKSSARRAQVTLSGGNGLGGTFRLDGNLDLTARTMQASLNLDKLKPLRRQDLRISLSGSGGVIGTLEAPFINANITVNEGELSLAHLPSGGSIKELPISSGEEAEPAPPKGVLSVRIDVPRRFFVRGRGLESEWKGNLHIGGPLNAPGILGSIDVVRGDFELLNRNFTFSKGSIQFAGSQKIDPRLDIIMTYKTSAIVAEAIVGGSASRPSFRLASQPSLPQDEIISQIMFGKYAQNLGRFEAIQLAGNVAALAGIGNGGLGVLSSTREALGVDMLRLNSSSDSDQDQSEESALTGTTLEMGKYITDKIYVGVEQGMKSDSTGALVEIELTPEISLEAKTNNEQTEAAIQWQHNY